MPPDGGSAIEVEAKASILRGLCASLISFGIQDEVLLRVSERSRALVLDPPPPTMWIDAMVLVEVQEAVMSLRGPAVLRQVQRKAVEQGVMPLLRAATEGLLRIFGATPATLLSRMGMIAGTTTRGIAYRYEASTATSGIYELEHLGHRDLPLATFVATAGATELVFDLCGVQGTIGDPTMIANGRRNAARFAVKWSLPRS